MIRPPLAKPEEFAGLLESQGEMIGPYDILLAAQALTTALTVTANTNEFQRVPRLTVENWHAAAT